MVSTKTLASVKFSTAYGINRSSSDDWFDPFLERDTPLFVDPFLIADDDEKVWREAHERLLGFFNGVLELLAKSGGDRTSPHWRKAERLMLFPEPPEFCLGFSRNTIFGHGTSKVIGKTMITGAMDALAAGFTHVDHLEDIALFSGGVGADFISDAACKVASHPGCNSDTDVGS